MSKKVALYCRVSTGNQSGVKQSRPSLDRMMKDVRNGLIEKVIVYSFSRYARSVTHLLRALEEFRKLNVGFVSITESIDTNTPLGAAVFTILGAVAQLERDLIAERVRNGLANAKAKGIRIGRLKTRDSDLIRKLRASGMTYRQIATIAKCSSGAVSAELRALKAEKIKLLEPKFEGQATPTTPVVQSYREIPATNELEFPIEEMKIELDFTRDILSLAHTG